MIYLKCTYNTKKVIDLITSWSYKIHCKLPNISYDPCIILIIVGSGSGKTNAFNQHQPETDRLF